MNDEASVRERHAAVDREFHERTAIDYDRVVHDPRRYPNDLLFAPLIDRIPRGTRMLDLGTGTGQMIERLADRFDEVVGVDHSPAMLERARAATGRQAGRQDIRSHSSRPMYWNGARSPANGST